MTNVLSVSRWPIVITLSVFLIGWMVYLLGPVLTPFLVAALLAYLGDPMADRLEAKGLGRSVAVCVVFAAMSLLFAVVLLVFVPLLGSQFDTLREVLPKWLDWAQRVVLPRLQSFFGIESDALFEQLKRSLTEHWQTAGGIATQIAATITQSSLAVFAWLGNLALIPVVTFYLLRDWDLLLEHIRELLPRSRVPLVTRLASECDQVLGAFLRGQLLIMVSLGAIYATGLWLVGLDLALLLGLIAGLASIVPYLGFIVGVLAAGVASLVQFHEPLMLLAVLAVFGVGQMAESLFLTPVLVGDRIGLHPVAVIFAVLAGGQLFGFVGILLGLPVAAVAMVILRHLHHDYRQSIFYSGNVDTANIAPQGDSAGGSDYLAASQGDSVSEKNTSSRREDSSLQKDVSPQEALNPQEAPSPQEAPDHRSSVDGDDSGRGAGPVS